MQSLKSYRVPCEIRNVVHANKYNNEKDTLLRKTKYL